MTATVNFTRKFLGMIKNGSENNILYINVPFHLNDELKKYGLRYDYDESKLWYVDLSWTTSENLLKILTAKYTHKNGRVESVTVNKYYQRIDGIVTIDKKQGSKFCQNDVLKMIVENPVRKQDVVECMFNKKKKDKVEPKEDEVYVNDNGITVVKMALTHDYFRHEYDKSSGNGTAFCKSCGWCPEFPDSHVEHSKYGGCEYIKSMYDISFDEDGEIVAILKSEGKKPKKKVVNSDNSCMFSKK